MLSNLNTVNPAEQSSVWEENLGLNGQFVGYGSQIASGVGHILKTDVGLGIILYTFHKKRSVCI